MKRHFKKKKVNSCCMQRPCWYQLLTLARGLERSAVKQPGKTDQRGQRIRVTEGFKAERM